MTPEYSAETITRLVLEHLERRRYAIRGDVARARTEISRCLEPLRRSVIDDDGEVPAGWLLLLERELTETLPERWCAQAERMTQLEQREFDLWRGGDLVARCTFVFLSLLFVAILAATDLPAWGKWLSLAAAGGTFFLPAVQIAWHRRQHERELDGMVRTLTVLDRHVETELLFLPPAHSG